MIYIVLPAFNEEKNLIKIFKKINTLKKKLPSFKVVLIDDCSSDNTPQLLKKKYPFNIIYKRHKKNRGLNYTLETGFKLVNNRLKKTDLVITMDSDNTHPVEIIPDMIMSMIKKKSDIMIASRFLKNSEVNGLSYFRKFLSLLAKLIFKIFFPYKNLKEYTCNYRIYKSFLIKKLMKEKIFFKNEDFSIAVKILIYFIKLNKNIAISEYPLVLNYHFKEGQSKMRITRNILLTLKLIIIKKFLTNT
tara:strand:+ start:347 stop:1084 length:738 start_codon:yes stop_codon:yes gene_type:complete